MFADVARRRLQGLDGRLREPWQRRPHAEGAVEEAQNEGPNQGGLAVGSYQGGGTSCSDVGTPDAAVEGPAC